MFYDFSWIVKYAHFSILLLLSRRVVVSRKAKKKQHALAYLGLRDHYNELFIWMAGLIF